MTNETLIFHNPGELDIRGACIMGLSAKDSESAIGYFGTGLKYAIASVLRWGGSIVIYAGISKYEFTTNLLDFRGREFRQIRMNGAELGFTTEYGKDWKPWQIFRELYANARDEGGGVTINQLTLPVTAKEGTTYVLVSGVPDLISAYRERDEIILPDDKAYQLGDSRVAIAKAPSGWLYYRGVRVSEHRCLYTYNFLKGLTLTEDRSLSSTWDASRMVRHYLNTSKDKDFIRRLLLIFAGRAESGFDQLSFESEVMGYYTVPLSPEVCSTEFISVVCDLYRQNPVRMQKFKDFIEQVKPELIASAKHKLTAREEAMLTRAKELVTMFGFADEVENIPITVEHLGGDLLGLYKHGRIRLSPLLFEQGTKQLVSTLYEECLHARTGYADCTYQMQTHLFNTIISLNEEIHGVIC